MEVVKETKIEIHENDDCKIYTIKPPKCYWSLKLSITFKENFDNFAICILMRHY